MNRAQRKLDRMSAEAWRELGADVRQVGLHLKQAGSAYAKKHPILVLGGGALLAAIVVWRIIRPAPGVVAGSRGVRKLGRYAWKLLRVGGVGLARAFSSGSKPAEKPEPGEPVEAGTSNGRSKG